MITSTHSALDEEFHPSAKILMVCDGDDLESVSLLVHHALARNWIPFLPDQFESSEEAVELAVRFAHSYGIEEIQIEWLQVTNREVFPHDFE